MRNMSNYIICFLNSIRFCQIISSLVYVGLQQPDMKLQEKYNRLATILRKCGYVN